VSQAHTDRRDAWFDGRIQLNGEAAPELEVILELDDQFMVLGHSSGELGRWSRNSVRVAPIGRGWFAIDVEDETVTFLPRRPGHFAAATVDLVPVEETKKRFGRRTARDKTSKESDAATLSRKERKRLRREEAAPAPLAAAGPVVDSAPPVAEVVAPTFEPGPAPDVVEPAPLPVESPPAPAEPVRAPRPEMRPPDAPSGPQEEPASPWDDLPVPEIPGRRTQRDKVRSRSAPKAPPQPAPKKQSKPPRTKEPTPPRDKTSKPSRGKAVELAGSTQAVRPALPSRPNAFSRLLAGSWHGMKGIALRISDELRQTGIVPFDRLPASSGRTRPNENHEHAFQEHRLPGGLTRNVCHACGLVSIGESSEDD